MDILLMQHGFVTHFVVASPKKWEGRPFSAHLLTTHPQNEQNVRKCRINILLSLLG
jgi:hypothetical protein